MESLNSKKVLAINFALITCVRVLMKMGISTIDNVRPQKLKDTIVNKAVPFINKRSPCLLTTNAMLAAFFKIPRREEGVQLKT